MIKVTVISPAFRENKGISVKTNKPYHMFSQVAYAHLMDKEGILFPFPEKFEVTLEKDENNAPKVYPPGEYQLHPASVYIGKFGLEVSPKLVPLKKAA